VALQRSVIAKRALTPRLERFAHHSGHLARVAVDRSALVFYMSRNASPAAWRQTIWIDQRHEHGAQGIIEGLKKAQPKQLKHQRDGLDRPANADAVRLRFAGLNSFLAYSPRYLGW